MTLARTNDPLTSHLAGLSVKPSRGQRIVLEAFQRVGVPMTDEQLHTLVRYELSPSGARTRRAELVERGLIVDTGKTVPSKSGRAMTRWALAAPPLTVGEQSELWGK